MAHRIWKETKQQRGTVGPGNMLGCCLIYFDFLWTILSTSTVQHWPSPRLPYLYFVFLSELWGSKPGEWAVSLGNITKHIQQNIANEGMHNTVFALKYSKIAKRIRTNTKYDSGSEEVVGKPQKGGKSGRRRRLCKISQITIAPQLSNKQRRKTKEALNASLVSLSLSYSSWRGGRKWVLFWVMSHETPDRDLPGLPSPVTQIVYLVIKILKMEKWNGLSDTLYSLRT